MPERDLTSESVVPTSGKTWGLRFSLCAMMVIVALLAGVFGYLSYYRPAMCQVHYQVATLAIDEVDRLGLKFHAVEDSPYQWVLDDEQAIADLLKQQQSPQPPFYQKQYPVANWPRQADSYSYIRHVSVDEITPAQASGEFAGFWGVQNAGGQMKFRAEAQIAHRQPAEKTVDDQRSGRYDEVQGKLFYEGALPKNYLVFAAPINKTQYHILLVEVSEVSESDPATYQPGTKPLPPTIPENPTST
ncbi:hypothetical protein [Bremerella alba]|uniref:Uncharacterized protein n=1 Tax=Bremerella alba TaxID=980252 RepID=A0A7V9A7U5_9BACT|nr:hypothetical protein [Bremerella alba]MBA2115790.1 hypothetical protein [Bremerella alba]